MVTPPNTRESLVYMAKLAEQAERYTGAHSEHLLVSQSQLSLPFLFTLSPPPPLSLSPFLSFCVLNSPLHTVLPTEMLESMQLVAMQGVELTTEELNLLSVALKNETGSRRAAWRILSSIHQKEQSKDPPHAKHIELIEQYTKKVEQELSNITLNAVDVWSLRVLPASVSPEGQVFSHKACAFPSYTLGRCSDQPCRIADNYRFQCEYSTGNRRYHSATEAMRHYKLAESIAHSKLKSTNPLRLGVALNLSVFYYEILNCGGTVASSYVQG